ncbi:MAG TPA: PQQ-binding-like beta-propeller repeat protein [Balneolaceae bacterium]|nr:PQQ-binding-like beta-propeller repeat protein [Balneolaceae bacterium]
MIINKQGLIEYEVIPEVPGGYVNQFNKPVVSKSGERLYVLSSYETSSGVNGRVTAYSLASESLLWRKDLSFPLPHIVDFLAPILQLKEAGNKVVVMTGPAIIALNTKTGEPVWTYLFYEGRTDINAGSNLTSQKGYVYAVETTNLVKLDLDGREIWKIPTGGLVERLFIADGNLYFSTGLLPQIITMHSVDARTGKLNYQFSSSDSGIEGSFSSAFDASDKYLVNIGLLKIYGYRQPE